VIDIFNTAASDAQSAFDEGNDKSMAANYLDNAMTTDLIARQKADEAVPEGWDDVQQSLDLAFDEFHSACERAKTALYSHPEQQDVASVTTPSDALRKALHVARLHVKAAGGNPVKPVFGACRTCARRDRIRAVVTAAALIYLVRTLKGGG
jgi:hypothetical protein